jgi:hypothetical protein
MNITKFDLFAEVYRQELCNAKREYPLEYVWAITEVDCIANRMLNAIKTDTFNKDSRAIKATCKRLKIKHTYKAIKDFLQ